LLGNCGTFSTFDSAVRAAHPIHLYDDGRPEFHARQIANFALAHLVRRLQLTAASRANQLSVAALAPYPKL
jgi:hypothetical protein